MQALTRTIPATEPYRNLLAVHFAPTRREENVMDRKGNPPTTERPPIGIPRLHWNTLQEVSVGLLRVHEQLDATAEGIMNIGEKETNIKATAHEIAMWGEVVHGLMKKLDRAIDRVEPEPDNVTAARA